MEISYELNEVESVAKQLIKHATSKTLLFYGNLGVGKTTLIKALAAQLGSDDDVSSPTFSIVNEYEGEKVLIYHFDLYRINDIEEAYNFGIEDYLNSKHWLFMEWSENIEELIPIDAQTITITDLQDNKRRLKLTFNTENLTEKTAMNVQKL